jgi:hypothetical protein
MLPSFGPQLTKNKGLTINNNSNWKHARDSREAGSGALVTCAKCMSQRQSPCEIRNRKVYGGTRIRPEKPVNHIWVYGQSFVFGQLGPKWREHHFNITHIFFLIEFLLCIFFWLNVKHFMKYERNKDALCNVNKTLFL